MVVNIVNMYEKPRANSPHGHKISPLLTSRTTGNFFDFLNQSRRTKHFYRCGEQPTRNAMYGFMTHFCQADCFCRWMRQWRNKATGSGTTVQVPSEYHRLCKTPAVLCRRVKRKIRSVVQVELHLPKSGHNGYPRSKSWDVHFWFPAALRFSSLNRSNMVWSTKNAKEFSFFWNN